MSEAEITEVKPDATIPHIAPGQVLGYWYDLGHSYGPGTHAVQIELQKDLKGVSAWAGESSRNKWSMLGDTFISTNLVQYGANTGYLRVQFSIPHSSPSIVPGFSLIMAA